MLDNNDQLKVIMERHTLVSRIQKELLPLHGPITKLGALFYNIQEGAETEIATYLTNKRRGDEFQGVCVELNDLYKRFSELLRKDIIYDNHHTLIKAVDDLKLLEKDVVTIFDN